METPSLEEQRLATHEYLVDYSNIWLNYKTRYDRSLGLDSGLAKTYEQVNSHMDYILERYFSLTAGVFLEALPTGDAIVGPLVELGSE